LAPLLHTERVRNAVAVGEELGHRRLKYFRAAGFQLPDDVLVRPGMNPDEPLTYQPDQRAVFAPLGDLVEGTSRVPQELSQSRHSFARLRSKDTTMAFLLPIHTRL